MFQRKRAANLRCRPAELATASATTRDLDHTERRTMANNRNLFDSCLHVFRNLDDSRQRWIAPHDPAEDVIENALDLSVDQIVDFELVKTVSLFQLPGAWATYNNLWLIFPDYRVGDNLKELMRVEGGQVFAEDLGVNICCIRDAEWIVGMNRQHLRLGANKFFKLIHIAGNYVFFPVFPQQQGLHHTQAIGHILRPAVWPRFVLKRNLIEDCVAEFVWDGGRQHLLPDAMAPLASFSG